MLENLFPKRLKQLRKERKWTQQKLAILAGRDARTIRRWENGESWPDPGGIQALAEALQIPVWKLFKFPDTAASE